MPGLNFQARFADAVKSGRKKQTIREIRKRPIVVGDTLKLMTGQRQKGKYRPLGEATCLSVEPIVIDTASHTVHLENGLLMSFIEMTLLVARDGFKSQLEFFEWFEKQYGERFEGVLIRW